MRRVAGLVVLVILFLSITCCSSNDIQATARSVKFEKKFNGFTGVFMLYDITENTSVSYNESYLDKQDTPCSTFKIMLSLIALQTDVLKDGNSFKKWNGINYPIKEWNKDHTLASALQWSVEWYFQDIAKEMGRDTMQDYLNKVGYGNQKIGRAVAANIYL